MTDILKKHPRLLQLSL